MVAFGRTSGWVAGPILLAVIASKVFVFPQSTFFIGIGIGFFISIFGIYRETKRFQRVIEEKDNAKTNGN